jgi:1,4-alpha-glucan branching enzyme
MSTYTTSDDGGVTSRPMNENEIAIYEALVADWAKEKANQDKAETDKATARQAVLDRLGITADEAALLLG